MSVAINGDAGSKEAYDNEFAGTPTVGDEDEAHEETADHRDGCGFTCSPFSSWG
ncbi:hypothetical protein [Natrinema marinum]|uniref:hypothetical protein n=1 Tax=Natrinema marinum TaxID=2961598 RepID=UPI0020C83C46|nr:hypothetical protein [Natrinema marinum]